MVAMHLNMIEDAKILLQEVGRYDVLIRFYITIGEYEKAIEIAKEFDRIDLENTYYRIAEHYDRINDIDKAIEYYKLSKCGSREIPKMLVQKNRIDLLENYMGKGEDKKSLIWWGTYLESQGEQEKALATYKKASHYSNTVRLLIFQGKFTEAKTITDDSKDQGACFLIGKYYESIDDIRTAIYYFAQSGRINQAIRLAREHNMDSDIFNLALKAPSLTQNLIAEYFENKQNYEKAINLYLLSGNIKKALNLCLIMQQYDKIREIADSIEYSSDKDTLRALAEYFAEQKQYEKSLSLYIKLKDYDMSMKLCENNKLKISLQTSKAILEEIESEKDNKIKNDLTNRLAKLLRMQGDFEQAHKIHVKLGNLKKAMKCLIKMGNKDRVTEFAQTCRTSELYIMAANFLQSLDWDVNEDLVKNIVSFYTKAKAFFALANFYELFANFEINEYRNYEKAVVLYQESINTVEKIKEDEDKKNEKIEKLNNKIKITKTYLKIMQNFKEDEEEALKVCNTLLNVNGIDDIIREGDIYSIMLEIYVKQKDYPSSYSVLEVLRMQKKVLTNYIDQETVY
jgi:intraflagellar transport protein 140